MFSSTFAFLGMQTELPVTLFILCFFLMKSHACIRHRHAMHVRVFFFFFVEVGQFVSDVLTFVKKRA